MNQSKALFNVLIVVYVIFHIYMLFKSPELFLPLLAIYGLVFLPPFLIGLILVRAISLTYNKREKEVAKYLDECDEKLKKGEMTKEDNDYIHFYYECGFNG